MPCGGHPRPALIEFSAHFEGTQAILEVWIESGAMKVLVIAALGAHLAWSSFAAANQSCDAAFSTMRKFEIDNSDRLRAALEITFEGLAKNTICTRQYLDAQDRVDEYYMKLAGLAKDFVSNCRGDPVRANDVFLYDLPEIQNVAPSSVRETCSLLEKQSQRKN
jgi:hypothetical protein